MYGHLIQHSGIMRNNKCTQSTIFKKESFYDIKIAQNLTHIFMMANTLLDLISGVLRNDTI